VELPRIGVWLGVLTSRPAAELRTILPELESLGYGCFWFAEGGGSKEAMSHSALLLAWTERAVVAPGIANIYARDAIAAANGAKALAEAYPGRFVLGLGVSHAPSVAVRGHVYGGPIETMRAYLDAIDDAPYAAPEPDPQPPRILAALGPRMLRLAAERSTGAHPYFVPVTHTAYARDILGTGPILAPEQGFVLDDHAERARAAARRHTERYLTLDNYRRNLLRLGYAEQELAAAGSDRVVDDVVAWGEADAVAARVAAHFDAGADHVCVQALGDDPLDELRRLAPALAAL
jgi:probable F420-dependent oxidoreductase